MDKNTKEKIKFEISRIDNLLETSKPFLEIYYHRDLNFTEKSATALTLHSFYNGIESIFVIILKSFGDYIPNEGRWHKTIFEKMFGDNSFNKQIISSELKIRLKKCLDFRHYIRHSYSSEIDWDLMETVAINLEETWKILKEDFEKFIEDN